MKMRNLLICLIVLCAHFLSAQSLDFEQFERIKWRNIGPAGMSGRVTAIDVNLKEKDHIIIGTASGGVWESKNGGISWKTIFDDVMTLSIGAVKFNQSNPDVIWVGTGEGNPRNSHNSGAGVYKTIDGGKTWKYMGLKETKLIHRIIIHKDNPNTVFVGALGSAWGPSEHRGVYKSTDGGLNWKKVLYAGDSAGVADMVVDPSNPDKLLAAMWEYGRTPWGFNSGGENSGLYLSYDGGENWKALTSEDGLPKGNLGRIGVAFAPSEPEIVYALVEAEKNALYRSEDGGEKWRMVSSKNVGNRPFYYAEIYVDPHNENRIYNLWSYVSRSEDGGKSFETIMDYGNSVHPDHHAFWIDPDDPDYLINGNDGGLNISRDGAKTWRFVHNIPVGQFYHVNVDNAFPYNVYGGMQDNGSWVGPGFVLKSGGIRNYDWQELYFGDGFDVAPRRDNDRYGYVMSQEGNLARYDRVTGRTIFIQPQHPEGEKLRYNWNAALAVDPFKDCGVYYGSQYVHYSSDCGDSWTIISPDLTTNDTLKQNQSKSGGLTLDITGAENHTTILAIAPSPHDEKLIYVSTDDGQLHVTRDGGENWSNIRDRLDGLPENAWLPQVVLSELNPQELFVVANNYRMNDWSAYLYHSLDGGESWTRIVKDDQVRGFVCSVVQDHVDGDLIFLGTDVGLYISLDHGMNWQKWETDLPSVQIRDMVIQKQFDDLVLGTFGRSFWILDDISFLRKLTKNGINSLDSTLVMFGSPDVYLTSNRSYDGIRFVAQGEFIGSNKYSGAEFTIWKKPDMDNEEGSEVKKENKKKNDKAQFVVINTNSDTIRTFERRLDQGMNRIRWRPDQKGVRFPSRSDRGRDSEPGGMPIVPGVYKVIISLGEHKDSCMLEVKPDPRESEMKFDPQAKYDAKKAFNGVVSAAAEAFDQLKEAKKSQELYVKIIDVQEDSIKKEHKKLYKEINEQLDSLMQLYMLEESSKPEYRDNSNTLNSKLSMANRFINTSTAEPSKNGQYAVETAIRETEKVLDGINRFFDTQWKEYIEGIKKLPMNIYKEYDTIEIK